MYDVNPTCGAVHDVWDRGDVRRPAARHGGGESNALGGAPRGTRSGTLLAANSVMPPCSSSRGRRGGGGGGGEGGGDLGGHRGGYVGVCGRRQASEGRSQRAVGVA
jgi:hypothetical protein